MVGRDSDTNLSRLICDSILKELEGPTKDRSTYWRRFCKVDIITSYHYIIVGYTYKRHTMSHEYNIIIHKSNIRLRMKHKQQLKRHPPCQPRLPAWNLSPDRRRSRRRTPRQANIALTSRSSHKPASATIVVVNCEPRGLSNPFTMGIKTSKA